MNTKNFSLKRIGTLIANDLKRYWVMMVAEFVVVFGSSSSTLLLDKSIDEFTIKEMITANSAENGVIVMFWPFIMALLVFGYLHRVNEVTAMHSLPVSRKEHFAAHTLSGYLMFALPVVVNGVILSLLARPTMVDGVNIFTIGAVVKCVLIMLLVGLVTYAFCVLAGMICGTSVMHVFGAIGLTVAIPLTLLVIDSNLELFVKGYCTPAWMEKAMEYLLPIVNLSELSAIKIVWFVILALVVLAISFIAYKKRPLENATDAIVFKFLEPIIVGVLTFIFASGVGEYFSTFGGKYLLGLAIGVVIGFIAFTMICQKTTRIFNFKNMRNGAIVVIVIGVFTACAAFDILGFAKMVPDAKDIESAEITSVITCGQTENLSDRIIWAYSYSEPKIEDEETIEQIRELHQKLIEKVIYTENYEDADLPQYFYIGIKYQTKTGTTIRRDYDICFDDAMKIDALRNLYESKKFKDALLYENYKSSDAVKISEALFSSNDDIEAEITIKDVDGLFKAMDEDYLNRSFKEETEGEELGHINIRIDNLHDDCYIVSVYKSDTNTLNFLRENGIL